MAIKQPEMRAKSVTIKTRSLVESIQDSTMEIGNKDHEQRNKQATLNQTYTPGLTSIENSGKHIQAIYGVIQKLATICLTIHIFETYIVLGYGCQERSTRVRDIVSKLHMSSCKLHMYIFSRPCNFERTTPPGAFI